jgi:hypothetical protein
MTPNRDWATMATALNVGTETAARERVDVIATDLRETLRWQASAGRVEHSTQELAREIGAPESVVRMLLGEMRRQVPERVRPVDDGWWRYQPVDKETV